MGLVLYYSAVYESDGEMPSFSFDFMQDVFQCLKSII